MKRAAQKPDLSWRIWAIAGLLALASCANTLSARVTTYQQWPVGVQGEYYRIVPTPAQTGSLEFGAFADMLRAAIGQTGLREAAGGAQARFDVHMQYGTELKQTWVQRYDDYYLNDGWMGPAFGGYYGGWGGWGGGIRSEEHTSELQSRPHLVCRLLLEKKKQKKKRSHTPKNPTKPVKHYISHPAKRH